MAPRIPALPIEDAPDEIRDTLEQFSQLRGDDAAVLNVFGTLANHPTLFRRWLRFANHCLLGTTLEPRLRELVVLRTGWRCRSPYEWGQHIVVGRAVGLDDDDVRRVAAGPDAAGWTPTESAALRAVDELHDRNTVTDATWAELTAALGREELLDLVFLVGQYHLVAFALNACGVERDDGVDDAALPFPPPAG